MRSPVDRLFDEHQRVMDRLDATSDVSLRIAMDDTLRKVLLLSAASYFERYITRAILDYVSTASNRSPCVMSLVESKAVKRQYHTYFDWTANNANSFFALFGASFKRRMKLRAREERELEESVRAFMRIGRERNKMVHDDFGSYSVDMTTEEIMELYRTAGRFVEAIPRLLDECIEDDRVIGVVP